MKGAIHMGRSMFAKSTLRQPVRTLFLLLVIGLASFVFVSRAAEYLLVKGETDRISGYYRAVGTLEALTDPCADAGAAAGYIAQSPYTVLTDHRRYSSALLEEGLYNADVDGWICQSYDGTQGIPGLHNDDVFFYGTLEGVFMAEVNGKTEYRLRVRVESVVTGYPEYAPEGEVRTLTTTRDLEEARAGLTPGGRYFFRAQYNAFGRRQDYRTSTKLYLKPLVEDGPWMVETPAGQQVDLTDPRLAGLAEEIALIHDNQRALEVVTTRDMSAMPNVQESARSYYLVEGRWLNRADDQNGNKVCVIHAGLAETRGLSVGDSLPLTMRNLDWSMYGYLNEGSDLDKLGRHETFRDTYEIVGIYDIRSGQPLPTRRSNTIYLPDSLLPESFGGEAKDRVDTGSFSFELSSPAREAAFLEETRDVLRELGFRATIAPTGWDTFQASAAPMRQSSLYNAVLFALLSALTLCIVVLVYFRLRRKEFAIARALGLPAGACAMGVVWPLLLLGAVGASAGGVLAWEDTASRAQSILSTLAQSAPDIGGKAALPVWWLALLCGGIFTVLLMAAAVGAVYLTRRPVLELLQGGAAGKKAGAPKPSAPGVLLGKQEGKLEISRLPAAAQLVQSPPKTAGAGQVLRFVWRHIRRGGVKSALPALLGAAFVVGLASIRLAIADNQGRLDALYDSISVDMELVKAVSSAYLPQQGGGFVYQSTIDSILGTGYIQDYYIEGAAQAQVSVAGGTDGPGTELFGDQPIRGIDNLDGFLERNGENIEIIYLNGWSEALFERDWAALARLPVPEIAPVIVPRELYDLYLGTSEDGGASQLRLTVRNGEKISLSAHEIAGVYDGGLSSAYAANPILIPNGSLRAMAGDSIAYIAAQFTLDSSRNRELEEFRTMIRPSVAGYTEINVIFWDGELKQVADPLAKSIQFLKTLYPVVLAVSLPVAAGVSILFTMMSAKEAAILRALGTTKLRSRVMLCLQMVFVCGAGVLTGIVVLQVFMGRAGLPGSQTVHALCYLAAAAAGSVGSAITVTAKNPLDLLQVRE